MLMEGETADISLFIAAFFIESFGEFSVLLEAVFLCHFLLFSSCLHDTSLCTKLFHLAFKERILAEFTFQTAVIEWYFDAWLQPYLVETLFTIAQNPSLIASEFML